LKHKEREEGGGRREEERGARSEEEGGRRSKGMKRKTESQRSCRGRVRV
jgi:hypothetical protein